MVFELNVLHLAFVEALQGVFPLRCDAVHRSHALQPAPTSKTGSEDACTPTNHVYFLLT